MGMLIMTSVRTSGPKKFRKGLSDTRPIVGWMSMSEVFMGAIEWGICYVIVSPCVREGLGLGAEPMWRGLRENWKNNPRNINRDVCPLSNQQPLVPRLDSYWGRGVSTALRTVQPAEEGASLAPEP